MTKVAGSYESVVRGVSEQVPHARRSGQHYEQINIISDPVAGAARRHGSVLQHEVIMGDAPVGKFLALQAATASTDRLTFNVEGDQYDIIYRTAADSEDLGQTGFAFCFNRETRNFVPVNYAPDDAALDTLVAGGVSAAVNIGRFIFLAGNTIVPSYTRTEVHAAPANQGRFAVWVRSGAYSRTFRCTLTRPDGTEVRASYKTVSASYPELLDTSDILTTDAQYQKRVNDRVNAYNSEVTKWIGTSAEDITSENIANELRLSLIAQGVANVTVRDDTVLIDDPSFIEISGEDGGDNSLLRAVGNELASADLLSTIHWVDKVVKVRPKKSNEDDAFYLKAYAKDNVSTGVTEVVWKEAAGVVFQPTTVFVLGCIHNGTLHLSSDPAALAFIIGAEVPLFPANEVGDDITSPLPSMFGQKIDYLGSIQDRLLIGTGSTILMSRPGKYFNWFRGTVLSLLDSDPVELFSTGAEFDVIKSSVLYDRNLMLFGVDKQYTINGRQPISPKNASIVVVSSYEETVDARPVGSGNLVFYAQRTGPEGSRRTSFYQVQTGMLADTPESADLTTQLSEYLLGTPREIVALTNPKTVFIRTTASRHEIATYAYLDNSGNGERLFDSWSKWRWDERVGDIIGMASARDGGGIFVYLIKQGQDGNGDYKWWVSCEEFRMETKLSRRPYADSLRPYTSIANPTSSINAVARPVRGCIAFGADSERPFIGAPLDELSDFLSQHPDGSEAYVGINYQSYVTPTNPYIRDKDGNAIVTGRLTINRYRVSIADTAGLEIETNIDGVTKTVKTFNGRILGASSNLIGYQPVVTTSVSGVIGKESRAFKYTLRARQWLPMTVTSIEWVGLYFNNTRRV